MKFTQYLSTLEIYDFDTGTGPLGRGVHLETLIKHMDRLHEPFGPIYLKKHGLVANDTLSKIVSTMPVNLFETPSGNLGIDAA